MSGRFAKLKKDWMLRGWTDLPFAVVNCRNNDQRMLKKLGTYTAQACDGMTDFSSSASLPGHNIMLDRMIKEGIAEECEQGDSIEPYQQYRKANNPHLIGITWSVTGRCNLNCRHCYMEAPSRRYSDMSFDESMGVIEQFERANLQEVSLTGGEPFLREDLLDIIKVLAQKKMSIHNILTNGLLITEDVLDGIKKVGFLPRFQISFDGVGVHDYMRGIEGIEQGVIESIRKVRASGFPVIIATSLDSVTKERMDDTYDLLKGLNVQSWKLAQPVDAGNWRGSKSCISIEEQAEVCESVLHRWLKDDRPFDINLSVFFNGNGKDGFASQYLPSPKYSPESLDCPVCQKLPYLLSDGTLLPCPGYTDSAMQDRMPNIMKDGLSSLWSESQFRSLVNIKKNDLFARNEECVSCELFEGCGMGCRALTLAETGDLMGKSPMLCEVWKKGYINRFLQLAGEAP